MIHFTPLYKRPALSALILLVMGSGFCQDNVFRVFTVLNSR